jgi:hypothetical protein
MHDSSGCLKNRFNVECPLALIDRDCPLTVLAPASIGRVLARSASDE